MKKRVFELALFFGVCILLSSSLVAAAGFSEFIGKVGSVFTGKVTDNAGSINILVYEEGTSMYVSPAEVTLKSSSGMYTGVFEGRFYAFSGVGAGTYTLEVKSSGYEISSQSIVVNIGTNSGAIVNLKKGSSGEQEKAVCTDSDQGLDYGTRGSIKGTALHTETARGSEVVIHSSTRATITYDPPGQSAEKIEVSLGGRFKIGQVEGTVKEINVADQSVVLVYDILYDICNGQNELIEYSCSELGDHAVTHTCLSGQVCKEGACVSTTGSVTQPTASECLLKETNVGTCTFEGTSYQIENLGGCGPTATKLRINYGGKIEEVSLVQGTSITLKNGIVLHNKGMPCGVWQTYLNFKRSATTPVQCTDSDKDSNFLDGKNYRVKGITKDAIGNVYEDWCSTNDGNGGEVSACKGEHCKLIEHYCDGGGVPSDRYICPNGCSKGACVSQDDQPVESEHAYVIPHDFGVISYQAMEEGSDADMVDFLVNKLEGFVNGSSAKYNVDQTQFNGGIAVAVVEYNHYISFKELNERILDEFDNEVYSIDYDSANDDELGNTGSLPKSQIFQVNQKTENGVVLATVLWTSKNKIVFVTFQDARSVEGQEAREDYLEFLRAYLLKHPSTLIPSDNKETPKTCTDACLYKDKCVPYGTRVDKEYCSIKDTLNRQKGQNLMCENNYECSSNLCVTGKCVDEGLFNRILEWFKKLFGGGQTANALVIEKNVGAYTYKETGEVHDPDNFEDIFNAKIQSSARALYTHQGSTDSGNDAAEFSVIEFDRVLTAKELHQEVFSAQQNENDLSYTYNTDIDDFGTGRGVEGGMILILHGKDVATDDEVSFLWISGRYLISSTFLLTSGISDHDAALLIDAYLQKYPTSLVVTDEIIAEVEGNSAPQTIGSFTYSPEGYGRGKTDCGRVEDHPDTLNTGIKGEVCTVQTTYLYENKETAQGIFVHKLSITSGRDLYQQVFAKMGRGVGGTTENPAFARVEGHELMWFTSKDADAIFTQEFSKETVPDGVNYHYVSEADINHPVVQEFYRLYPVDSTKMKEVFGKKV